MKIRKDFVTNSSSSSYVIIGVTARDMPLLTLIKNVTRMTENDITTDMKNIYEEEYDPNNWGDLLKDWWEEERHNHSYIDNGDYMGFDIDNCTAKQIMYYVEQLGKLFPDEKPRVISWEEYC